MIPHYRDHAANERTYLAWVRTGITVMMLGFLVERFEIFLAVIVRQTGGGIDAASLRGPHSEVVILALVGLGMFMIAAATVRMFVTRKAVDGEQAHPFRGTWLMLVVSAMMIAFGAYLLSYLAGLL